MEYPVPNADRLRSIRLNITVANAFVRLPTLTVPDDMSLLVKADPGNPIGSLLRVADSEQNAVDPNNSYPLVPNEFRALRIKNASNLYISATIVPAWVIVSAEQREEKNK